MIHYLFIYLFIYLFCHLFCHLFIYLVIFIYLFFRSLIYSLLFWTDWGTVSKIEKCNLAGEERHVVTSRGLTRPLGLTIDYDRSLLFWVEQDSGAVESMDFNGGQRTEYLRVPGTKFFGLALYHVRYF